MMYHENVGEQRNSSNVPSQSGRPRNTTRGPRGVNIFSHIRRFAVIRQRRGYCLCVPINSYNSKGAGSKKIGDEIKAHAIIYDAKYTASKKLANESAIHKDPIAVDMAEGETLDIYSRIHFAKVHTVEFNVRVLDVGRIALASMPFFERYCNQEFNGVADTAT